MELVLIVDTLEDGDDVGLEDHAGHDDLVQDVVHLVRVEDEVQLAHVFEALVQRFHEDCAPQTWTETDDGIRPRVSGLSSTRERERERERERVETRSARFA